MLQYIVNEAAFALPSRPFVDRTLHRLAAPMQGSEDPVALEIRRVPMGPDRTLRQLVDEAVAAEQAKQNGFVVDDTVAAALDGAPALLLRARLRARDTVYIQRQAHVAFDGIWLAFVVTGPGAHRAVCEDVFHRLVTGLRWRRG